jgi:DNA mismatch repair protein MutS
LAKKKKEGKSKVTPLMRQYFQMKAKYPDAILLYRVGDFYETFGDDAEKAAKILGIVLTSRNNGGSDIALAGFPHHALDTYLPKLVKSGLRVALCEQLEKPTKGKNIVKRGVTEIVTPGLAMSDQLLDHKSNNYLASLHFQSAHKIGIAFLDLSTGEFLISEGGKAQTEKLLQSFQPSEVIFAKHKKEAILNITGSDYHTYGLEDWIYTLDFGRETLLRHFNTPNLKGFGVDEMELAQIAAGAILRYLDSTENNNASHVNKIKRIQNDDYIWLDRFTIQNLELLKSAHPTGTSLVEVLDRTVSPMGARQLKKWVVLPLTLVDDIHARHDIVSYLINHQNEQGQLQKNLSKLGDLERLVSRIPMGKINPRELMQLKKSLDLIPEIQKILRNGKLSAFTQYTDTLNDLPAVRQKIKYSLQEEPPTQFGKEDVIADGYHPELDDYRYTIKNAKQLLLDIQTREANQTGINSLKIGFNNVFGYYLEVTNKYKGKDLVPDSWIRKQTLTNSERYITEELKTLEEKILGAEEKALSLEKELFEGLVNELIDYIEPIQLNAEVLGALDVLQSFSSVSHSYHYTRPKLTDGLRIDIKNGRHPVIEHSLPPSEPFIPNDLLLDNETQQIMMITGPNMSGKSAILRQTALICLMAQMGCFVPADHAEIGWVDKIFTRVGASDNITSGESTFMLEMNETSSILNNVSERSLILLDEIGRGTSTYDGISIAWAIAEFLHNHALGAPKTLFATHYHELNELAEKYDRIQNFNVSVQETGDKIVFLRKLEPGGSAHSFGIHVAKMAGMPQQVLLRAQQILSQLEQKSIQGDESKKTLQNLPEVSSVQLSIFETSDPKIAKLRKILEETDVTTMTPIDCMLKLKELTDLYQ